MKYDKREDEPGKLFVGGLSWETTKDSLQTYFSQYGEVSECIVPKDVATGRSRGFGFVTFKDESIVSVVLSSRPHHLDGRAIDVKVCASRNQHKSIKSDDVPKIFMGGLTSTMSEAELREAFSKFGTVIDIAIMNDQETGKCRGFGFLSFESEDSVRQACAHRYIHVAGKQIEVKPATRRAPTNKGPDSGGGSFNLWNGMQPSTQQYGQQWSQSGYGSSGGATASGDSKSMQQSFTQYEWGPTAQQFLSQAATGYGTSYPSYYGGGFSAASYGSYGTDSSAMFPGGNAGGATASGYSGFGSNAGTSASNADTDMSQQYSSSKTYDKEENYDFDGQDYNRSGNFGASSSGASNRSQQNYHPYRR